MTTNESKFKRIPSWEDCFKFFKKENFVFDEIIDVGAAPNFRSFTTEIIKYYPTSRYHLIEPQIRFNEKIADVYKGIEYTIYNEVVGDSEQDVWEIGIKRYHSDGPTHVFTSPTKLDLGWNESVNGEVLYSNLKKIKKLDNLIKLNSLSNNVFLKIDVDGSDLFVLKGATNLLSRVNGIQIEASLSNIAQIINFLDSVNFQLIDVVDPCYYNFRLTQLDLIFLSREEVLKHSIFDNAFQRNFEWDNSFLFNYPYMS